MLAISPPPLHINFNSAKYQSLHLRSFRKMGSKAFSSRINIQIFLDTIQFFIQTIIVIHI